MRRAFFFSHDFEEMDDEEMFDQMVNIFEALREQAPQPSEFPKPEPTGLNKYFMSISELKRKETIGNDEILNLMLAYNMPNEDIQDVFNFHLD